MSFAAPRGKSIWNFVMIWLSFINVRKMIWEWSCLTIRSFECFAYLQDRYKTKKGHDGFLSLWGAIRMQTLKYIMFEIVTKQKKDFEQLSVNVSRAASNGSIGVGTLLNTLPLLCESLITKLVLPSSSTNNVLRPSREAFVSCTTNQSAISCYFKVDDGLLYPMKSGLLFLQKPIMFIPRDRIDEIMFGRGGSSSTRTVDLSVSMTDGSAPVEFRMISREEQQALRDYAQILMRLRDRRRRRTKRRRMEWLILRVVMLMMMTTKTITMRMWFWFWDWWEQGQWWRRRGFWEDYSDGDDDDDDVVEVTK